MTSDQLRSSFLDYFEKKGHRKIPSSSLIPDDPTLLLTIAGMVQFKPIFLGKVKPTVKRACTAQKCLRVNDIEKVGYTARHHTFFEMLGNFSFGDYFKHEACCWAWEYLTEVVGLDSGRMWTSVHRQDREACQIWQEMVGVPVHRIVSLGDEDNFWAAGPVGPCGYCSEIYYDTGEDRGCGSDECQPGCECDRYLEIWNLVFMQFDRKSDGSLEDLPSKNIDTGMGLERIASVVQSANSNFETDLFMPVMHELEQLSGQPYRNDDLRPHFRVVADHIRSIAFLMADGVYPANEGRGYILRRLIRRAYRSGKKLSIEQPFLFELIHTVVSSMKNSYPELNQQAELIARLTLQEEKRFEETMHYGLTYLDQVIDEAQQQGKTEISGWDIFRLYDTYGFPVDITREILQEAGLSFSENDFQREMETQKTKSRQAQEVKTRDIKDQKTLEESLSGLSTEFAGYRCHHLHTRLLAIVQGDEPKTQAKKGDNIICVLEKTPFYPERGGQESDHGVIMGDDGCRVIIDQAIPGPNGAILHLGTVEEGIITAGTPVTAQVDVGRRRRLEIHHTATHLLHRALREVLGDSVKQAGSWVGETGLRFDFTHFSAVSEEELNQVENLVNRMIFLDLPVRVTYSTLDEVREGGIVALFDEKYEDRVRIVRVEGFSAELCGGTHLERTSQAELFTILAESSIGAGVRRVEAVAGPAALEILRKSFQVNQTLKKISQAEIDQLPMIFSDLQDEIRRMKKELSEKMLDIAIRDVLSKIPASDREDPKPILVSHLFDGGVDQETMKRVLDHLRHTLPKALVVLGSRGDEMVSGLVAGIGLSHGANLGALLRDILPETGGRGGGKPQLAQYGGLPVNRWNALVQALGEGVGCRLPA